MSAFWFQMTDFARLAGEGFAIDTSLSVDELPRVAEAVLSGSGPFHVQFGFEAAQKGIVLADGQISGQLKLRCERCLDELTVDVESHPRLALLKKAQLKEQVAEGYEPLVFADGEVRIADLIEDEILLTLPIAAKHVNDDCVSLDKNLKAIRQSGEAETVTPFAGLAKMMRDQTD